MPIFSVGLNHRTAPLEIREEAAFLGEDLFKTLERLHAHPDIDEIVILSTCNRTEIYVSTLDLAQAHHAIELVLTSQANKTITQLRPYLYRTANEDAIGHLMQVACGLDSLILGEPQILGQVNSALQQAQQAQTCGLVLSQLFTGAIRAGKRARTETDISRHTTSTSHAAILLAQSQVSNLATANVLLVGAGDMATLAVKALGRQPVGEIGCINRTKNRAEALAKRIGGRAFNWMNLSDALVWADVVITATGAPHTVIHQEDVAQTLPQRNGRPLFFIDIALPRDVEASVDDLPLVSLHDIDDLKSTLDSNLAQREAARPAVMTIIAEEREEFVRWQRSRRAVPILVNMRQKVQDLAQAELAEALAQLPNLDPEEAEIVEKMVHRLVNKILHEPTVQLKEAAADSKHQGHRYAEVVQNLFGLESIPGRYYHNQPGDGMLRAIQREERYPPNAFRKLGDKQPKHWTDTPHYNGNHP